MRERRLLAGVIAVLILGGACSPVGESRDLSAPTETPQRPADEGDDGLLIDPAITPVSASNPSPEARAVQKLCWTYDDSRGLKAIAGMGRIDHARDAAKYTWLTGREPEIQTDEPAWLIVYRGEMPQSRPVGDVWVDPTCVVIDDAPIVYATGPIRTADGVTVTPPPLGMPTMALPPLAP